MRARNGAIDHGERANIRLLSRNEASELAMALASELDRLRHIAHRQPQDEDRIIVGPLSVDIGAYEVVVDDSTIALRPREFALLKALAQNLGRVLSREQVLSLAWPDPQRVNSNRTVDTHIHRLRLKLGKAASLIRTVGGTGYKLVRVGVSVDANRKYIS